VTPLLEDALMTMVREKRSVVVPPDGDDAAPLLDDEDAVVEPSPESYMLVRANLTCYLCGRSAGLVESPMVRPWPALVRFQPFDSPTARLATWQRIRCTRCGGPTFLEDFETVRQRVERIDWDLDAPRRGRPPTWLIELRRRNSA
jgi:ribosomal protein S14